MIDASQFFFGGGSSIPTAHDLTLLLQLAAFCFRTMVEDIIRTSKSILETRPIYHKRDETIRGHVFCSFLALVLKQELESRMKRTDLEWKWKEVIRGLDALQQVEANFQGFHTLV